MKYYHWFWMIPLVVLCSPIGGIIIFLATGSYYGFLGLGVGLCIIAAGGAGE